MQNKNTDLVTLILLAIFPFVAIFISLVIRANFLISTLLFFGLPALWLTYKIRDGWYKTFFFSLIFALPLTLIIDYIAVVSNAWTIPVTVFPFRVLNVVTIEEFIWGVLFVYGVGVFYEYFFRLPTLQRHLRVNKKMKLLMGMLVAWLAIFLTIFYIRPELLKIPYAYLWEGMFFIFLPATFFLTFFPQYFKPYLKTAAYFFCVGLAFELTALHLNQWTFPLTGEFLGWVNVFGYRFPFEEFFFWIVVGPIGVLSYYSFYSEDLQR